MCRHTVEEGIVEHPNTSYTKAEKDDASEGTLGATASATSTESNLFASAHASSS